MVGTTLEWSARGPAAAALGWWIDAGVDWDVGDTACDWLAPPRPAPIASPRPAPSLAPRSPAAPDLARADALARAADSPTALIAAHADLFGRHAMFLEGDPAADLVLAVAAPEPSGEGILGGTPGALLSAMLASIGRERATICLLALAPRTAAPASMAGMTLPFVRRLADLSRPKAILALGSDATTALTGMRSGVGRLRGQFVTFAGLASDHPLLPTFHPGLLVATPTQKAAAWADLLTVKAKLA